MTETFKKDDFVQEKSQEKGHGSRKFFCFCIAACARGRKEWNYSQFRGILTIKSRMIDHRRNR